MFLGSNPISGNDSVSSDPLVSNLGNSTTHEVAPKLMHPSHFLSPAASGGIALEGLRTNHARTQDADRREPKKYTPVAMNVEEMPSSIYLSGSAGPKFKITRLQREPMDYSQALNTVATCNRACLDETTSKPLSPEEIIFNEKRDYVIEKEPGLQRSPILYSFIEQYKKERQKRGDCLVEAKLVEGKAKTIMFQAYYELLIETKYNELKAQNDTGFLQEENHPNMPTIEEYITTVFDKLQDDSIPLAKDTKSFLALLSLQVPQSATTTTSSSGTSPLQAEGTRCIIS